VKLLQLSPEVMRLRRVARACAAGELSRIEYRQARREVICKFAERARDGDEATVPRDDLDITQRRGNVSVAPAEAVQRPNWSWWAVFVALIGAALLVPLWSQAAVVIQAVSERDPNPASAPSYQVEGLQWVVPDAFDDDMAQAAQTYLDEQLAVAKKHNAPLSHGFSAAELEQIGRFLNAVGVHDADGEISRRDVQDLNALIQSQKERRGVSLPQLEQIAQDLQTWIRARGFPLARVYVPAQTLTDNQVQLHAQLGVLGSIRVDAPAQGDSAVIQGRMRGLLGQPVRRDMVETRLNSLNRSRWLHAEASFVPGREVGETEMVLQVKQHKRFTGGVALDNYGVKDLGEERLAVAGQWNNPRGVGDVLAVQAFTTVDPADHQYGQLSYRSPVMDGRFDADAQIAFADISLGQGTPLDGDGVLLDVQLVDTHLFTRTQRRETFYKVGVHDLDWDAVPGQRSWFLGAGITGHRLWDARRLALSGSVEGLFGGMDDTRPGQDSTFWRVRGALNAWAPVDLPWLDLPAKLVMDVHWQIANDLLPPTLRLGATGPYANKGFEQATTMLDQGLGLSGSVRFDAPVGQWWLFMDATYGEQEGEIQRWRSLTSAGLGWEGRLLETSAGQLSSRVTLGYPLSHKGTQGMDDDGTQLYWSLRFDH
jgi:hemolysin activation/secretion protein